jgi:pimeloyl-ACP methyl ester carboxylesterase
MDAKDNGEIWDVGERSGLAPIQDSLEYLVSVPIDPIKDEYGEHFDLYYFVHTPEVRTLKAVLFCAGGPGQIVRPFDRSKTYVDFLAKNGYNVVFFHLRGTGFSQLPPVTKYDDFMKREYAIRDMEAIRRHFLEETLGGKNVKWEAVIGWSFGTVLAHMYAYEFGSRLEKLVLISPLSRHRFSESKVAFEEYYCRMLEIYHETLKKIYCSKHEALENEFGDMAHDEVSLVLNRLFDAKDGILKRTEEIFGNMQVVVDSYSKLSEGKFPDHIKYSRDFYQSLRDLRFLGSNSIDDTGGTYEKQRLIAKNLRDEVLGRTDQRPRRQNPEANPSTDNDSRCQGSQRAYYSFGVRDGINWTFLDEYYRTGDVKAAVRSMGGRGGSGLERVPGVSGWLNKIEAGSLSGVEAWDPKRLPHNIPTLIVNGGADPVTAGGQAERYFHPYPPGARTLISFPGIGHNISLGSWNGRRLQQFRASPPPLNGAIHLPQTTIPGGEVREVAGVAKGWRLDPNLKISVRPPEDLKQIVKIRGCGILRGSTASIDQAKTGSIVALVENISNEATRIDDRTWELETGLFTGTVRFEGCEPFSKGEVRLIYGRLIHGQIKNTVQYQIKAKNGLQKGLKLVGYSLKPPSSVELWIQNSSSAKIDETPGDWTIKSRSLERTFRVNLPEIQPGETRSVTWGVDGLTVSVNEALKVEQQDESLSKVIACLQPENQQSGRLAFAVWNQHETQQCRVGQSKWSVKTAAFSVTVLLDPFALEPGAVTTVEGDALGMEWAKCLDFKPESFPQAPLQLVAYNIESENELSLLLRNPTGQPVTGEPCDWIYVIPASNAHLVDLNQALNVLLFSFLVLQPEHFHDRKRNQVLDHILAKFENVGLQVGVKPESAKTSAM